MLVARSDDPPPETSGKGTPVMGRIPIFIPICTNVWAKRVKKIPAVYALAAKLLGSEITLEILQKTAKRPTRISPAPTRPISSAIEAKIKSVCRSGRNASCV